MSKDYLYRSALLVVCGNAVDETMKNDIALAARFHKPATTLEGILTVKGQGRRCPNLFEIFNMTRPADFTGHSLSVSDIVALKQNGVVSYHYCDSVGFQELSGFMSENYLKAAEMSLEDDYGMIDGIINNGQKPTLSDLEQQVKNGQSISLMDLAEAVQREKKPSVLKKLKEQPPQSASKRKLQKTKEKEI